MDKNANAFLYVCVWNIAGTAPHEFIILADGTSDKTFLYSSGNGPFIFVPNNFTLSGIFNLPRTKVSGSIIII